MVRVRPRKGLIRTHVGKVILTANYFVWFPIAVLLVLNLCSFVGFKSNKNEKYIFFNLIRWVFHLNKKSNKITREHIQNNRLGKWVCTNRTHTRIHYHFEILKLRSFDLAWKIKKIKNSNSHYLLKMRTKSKTSRCSCLPKVTQFKTLCLIFNFWRCAIKPWTDIMTNRLFLQQRQQQHYNTIKIENRQK